MQNAKQIIAKKVMKIASKLMFEAIFVLRGHLGVSSAQIYECFI